MNDDTNILLDDVTINQDIINTIDTKDTKSHDYPLGNLILSLIWIVVCVIALTMVIIYPYFSYIYEHSETHCDVCYCKIIPYGGTCYNDKSGNEHCDNVNRYGALIVFTFSYSNTSHCNQREIINIDDFHFCNNLNESIPCYYDIKDPEGSIQLSHFFPSRLVIGISILSFWILIGIIIMLISVRNIVKDI